MMPLVRQSPSAIVMALVESIVEAGGEVGGVPRLVPLEAPPKPHDIETNNEARAAWRRRAAVVKNLEHERKSQALSFMKTLLVTREVSPEEALWFPFNCDFRGRIYPVASYLSPQGDDLSRGLLTFAEGKALGEGGGVWLALHGARCLGETTDGLKLTKAPLQERVDWIVGHTVEIEQVAADPLAFRWWEDADDPFQFYAFCVEWAAFVQHERRGEGAEFVSHLPCSMDGSCNGLQHFAAMLRDEVGGKAVNLVPAERPHDLYSRIADSVLDKLEELAPENPMAALWLDAHGSGLLTVGRKLCKRPTMTFGYGSKQYGFAKQLRFDEIPKLCEWAEFEAHFTSADDKDIHVGKACTFMSELIWRALREVVVAAYEGMDWMQAAARVVAKYAPLEWTVPITGFPVRQEYFEVHKKQIKTLLAGRLVQPSYYERTAKINTQKQANAIAPNFIHSLDAAALMLTVVQCAAEGVTHFICVHDSYGTHAADCPVLACATRQGFVRLHTEPIIETLHNQFLQQAATPGDVPDPPAKGNLDLGGVLASDYFFI